MRTLDRASADHRLEHVVRHAMHEWQAPQHGARAWRPPHRACRRAAAGRGGAGVRRRGSSPRCKGGQKCMQHISAAVARRPHAAGVHRGPAQGQAALAGAPAMGSSRGCMPRVHAAGASRTGIKTHAAPAPATAPPHSRTVWLCGPSQAPAPSMATCWYEQTCFSSFFLEIRE